MKTILCYGDSNTYGTAPLPFDRRTKNFIPSNFRLPYASRWTTILSKGLGEDYQVIVEGLKGRTTVFDNPVAKPHVNGLTYLLPCLESHAPIDLVLLMLGTNDLQTKFSMPAYEIAQGMGVLIKNIQSSRCGVNGEAPKILVMCPPPLGKLTFFKDIYDHTSHEKSAALAFHYEKNCQLYDCNFLDVGSLISMSDDDGLHFEEADSIKLGKALISKVKELAPIEAAFI